MTSPLRRGGVYRLVLDPEDAALPSQYIFAVGPLPEHPELWHGRPIEIEILSNMVVVFAPNMAREICAEPEEGGEHDS